MLVTDVSQYCLRQVLATAQIESESIDRLLLSLIVHCSKDEDTARAIAAINSAFSGIIQVLHVASLLMVYFSHA